MTSDTIELVERVRSRLKENESTCKIAGPVPESAICAAEEALGCTFPPSYRTFLRTFGGIAIPSHLGVVHDFVGVAPDRVVTAQGSGPHGAGMTAGDSAMAAAAASPDDVVGRTLSARVERKLAEHLIVVGLGAQYQEWFCLDTNHTRANGECPILLFDARDNAVDQQFYDDFGQMLQEVMGFVADSLDQPLD